MAQEIINVGAAANDGLGDPIRTAFIKCNENFTELYSGSGGSNGISNGNSFVQINTANGNISMSVGGSANVAVVTTTGITVGNVTVPGLISASGNVFGANLRTSGAVSAAGNITASFLFSLGAVSAAGNILGNYFFGNGSQLTGITTNYSNANVASFMAAFGSNAISTTGNVTANNFIGGGAGTPTLSSATNLDLSANVAVRVTGGGTFRLPSLTAAQIANIVAANGDLVYNTTVNKIQGYENGSWGNLI